MSVNNPSGPGMTHCRPASPAPAVSPEAVLRMLFAYEGDSFEDRLRQELAKQTFVGGKRVVKQKVPGLAEQAETTVHVVKVVYVYDFGDDWRHDIVVERILPAAPGIAYPRCTGGRGETPAEDSGGIWAFNEERARDGSPGGGFDPGDLTKALADLAGVITPAS